MKNNEMLVWIIALISFVILWFSGFGFCGYRGMMGTMYGNYGPGMMFFGWVYGILILTALILFIVWLVKRIQKE